MSHDAARSSPLDAETGGDPTGPATLALAEDTAAAPDPLDRRLMAGLVKVGLATRHRAWAEAGHRGLTPTQGQILALLRHRRGAETRLAQIAEGLAVTPATASVALGALVDKGLARKVRAASDARALAVTLTDEGRREADRAAGWSDFLLAAVDVLSPREQEVFLRGVVKIIRTLQVRGEIPVSGMCVTCRFFRPDAHPGADRPHHCAFVDAPFGDRDLRLECADHRPASHERAEDAWAVFAAGGE